jgi:hypothetical protein
MVPGASAFRINQKRSTKEIDMIGGIVKRKGNLGGDCYEQRAQREKRDQEKTGKNQGRKAGCKDCQETKQISGAIS